MCVHVCLHNQLLNILLQSRQRESTWTDVIIFLILIWTTGSVSPSHSLLLLSKMRRRRKMKKKCHTWLNSLLQDKILKCSDFRHYSVLVCVAVLYWCTGLDCILYCLGGCLVLFVFPSWTNYLFNWIKLICIKL